jgi:hypothetical protein
MLDVNKKIKIFLVESKEILPLSPLKKQVIKNKIKNF